MRPTTFAMATGILVGTTGLLGMFTPLRKRMREKRTEMKSTKGYGKIVGVIPTNDAFNWVRLGIGAAGIASSFDEKSAKIYNRSVAISYAGMAVMGVLPKTDTLFGMLPIFGGNVYLHAGTALAEILAEEGLVSGVKEKIGGLKNSSAHSEENPVKSSSMPWERNSSVDRSPYAHQDL